MSCAQCARYQEINRRRLEKHSRLTLGFGRVAFNFKGCSYTEQPEVGKTCLDLAGVDLDGRVGAEALGKDVVLQLRVDPEDGDVNGEGRLEGEADVDTVLGLREKGHLVPGVHHLVHVVRVRDVIV